MLAGLESTERYSDSRGNVIEIDGAAFAANVVAARDLMAPGAGLYQVVKADGYGLGLERAVQLGLAAGVEGFCVGLPEEALRAKAVAPAATVLLFTACPPTELADLARRGIVVTVHDAAAYAAVAPIAGAEFLFEVDCGFGRFGLSEDQLAGILAQGRSAANCSGAYTHFGSRAASEFDGGLKRFDGFATTLKSVFGDDLLLMAAASHGLLWRPGLPYSGAHPGSLLYGLVSPELAPGFRPVLRRMTSRLLQINAVATARSLSVGYGDAICLPAGGATGVFPLGWNDGLSTGAALGHVLVRNRPAPVIARTLLHSIVDLSAIDGATAGDEVVVIDAAAKDGAFSIHAAAQAMALSPIELHFRLAGAIARSSRDFCTGCES